MIALRFALTKKQTPLSMYGGNSARKPAGNYVDKRHLHAVLSSDFVGSVDMVVDMVVMLKMKLSSDDISHHLLLHTKGV